MDAVFQVWGAGLDSAVWVKAGSETEAIETVADAFRLEKGELEAAQDSNVSIPRRGMILQYDGAILETKVEP